MRRALLGLLLVLASLAARADQDLAPLFAATLPDLATGKPVALADYRGKPLVVNFWARWCGPCRAEIPEFHALWNAYGHRGLTVVGIGLEDDQPNVHEFVKAYQMDYPVLLAKSQGIDLMKALGNERAGLPFTLVIDRAGKVVMSKLGKASRAELETAADAALK